MNPHYIFNALNEIQNVIFNRGQLEANQYISSFSKLLRHILEMSNSEYITLEDEISYLKAYLILENLKLNKELNINFYVSDRIDVTNTLIPCMLIQPIIENSIQHGLLRKKEDKKLSIGFLLQDNLLIVIVEDNGIGKGASMKKKKKYKSMATSIMNDRIDIRNEVYKNKIDLKIEDLCLNNKPKGTKVILNIQI